ncbi:F0F1 ATP synthase subunit A [Pyxidicoccus parkwayensis]|uniref:ATP synthase subunit a n=1 Tax=Pyxidicoccus parkwayensis TaxID=2813578 RepID=A0ABX7NUA1_9BACT|nr:F0F1 ATP synthase subunit A [Pyxidicoccus parkwaysis]QSQ20959.1 F0F1 ATP synthase subunit A [Pyxidicoccus parkwaysis]
MRKAMVLIASLFAAAAWASPEHGEHAAVEEHGAPAGEHGAAAGEHDENVPEYIIHHVSDSREMEFEVPLGKPIHLGTLPSWTLGNCTPKMTDHGEVVPGITEGCLDISLTKHTVMMFVAAGLLLITLLIWSNSDKTKLVPRGTGANLIEMLVLFVRDELAIKNIGKEEGPRYTPYLLTAFFFILFMNLLGLVPWMSTATGNIAVTASLALCTFIVTQVAGIRAAGLGGYLKHLTGGVAWWLWPIMIPVEVLGLFTKPFALTMRLFANMLAGHIVLFFLLGLIFILGHPGVAAVSVPFAFAIYLLELFVAFVQAYVFTMLSALFIGMSVAMGHHGHDDHGHEGGHSHDHGAAHH